MVGCCCSGSRMPVQQGSERSVLIPLGTESAESETESGTGTDSHQEGQLSRLVLAKMAGVLSMFRGLAWWKRQQGLSTRSRHPRHFPQLDCYRGYERGYLEFRPWLVYSMISGASCGDFQ